MLFPKKILLIHQDFPGQFIHMAKGLVDQGHEVHSIGVSRNHVDGVISHFYTPDRSSTPQIHPWVIDFESQVIRGEAVYYQAAQLKESGFIPDLIIAHPGWGECLFLRDVWPASKLIIYCEFFYQAKGADIGFDPEFSYSESLISNDQPPRIKLKNLANLLIFDNACAGLAPTHWQKSLFPEPFRSKIEVIHDGIDTKLLSPNSAINIRIKKNTNQEIPLKKGDEIITFVNRNLEPYRGYHIFMRALPRILQKRPNAHVLIIGGNGVGYGRAAPNGQSWQNIYLEEVIDTIDLNRVHFLGRIPYKQYIKVLQISSAHIYLTYPFVLSWSLLEAMSIGCPIIASNTQPVQEVIHHKKNGVLVDFFNIEELANTVIELLATPLLGKVLGDRARIDIQKNFDLNTICLPKQLKWLNQFM